MPARKGKRSATKTPAAEAAKTVESTDAEQKKPRGTPKKSQAQPASQNVEEAKTATTLEEGEPAPKRARGKQKDKTEVADGQEAKNTPEKRGRAKTESPKKPKTGEGRKSVARKGSPRVAAKPKRGAKARKSGGKSTSAKRK